MASYDILVAGGGPAGLSAARAAAQHGCQVLVVEQQKEIGSPIRTSGGSFIADLEAFNLPARLYHPIHRLRFRSPGSEAVFHYPNAALCIIDVRGTYQFLAEQAIAAGAHIRMSTAITAPLLDNGRVVGLATRTPRNEGADIRAPLTIDATGYRASVARAAGLHPGFRRFGVGSEYDMYAPHCDQAEALLLIGTQIAPGGYAWVFPWGGNRVRVGVGVQHGGEGDPTDHPTPYLDRLVSQAGRYGVNLRGAQPVEYHHGLIPAEGLADPLIGDGILAVGDAGGQASALVGEGIRWAIAGGRLAGGSGARAIQAQNTSAEGLKTYSTEWIAAHGRNLGVAYEINRRMTRWDDEKWDQRIRTLQGIDSTHIITLLRSDFSPRALLQLAVKNPGLWRGGFRELLSRLG